MFMPRRLKQQSGRYSKVDGIPYELPVNTESSPALMAAFTVDWDKAAALMPGNEVHPFRLWGNKGLLFITVINYQDTDIGKYIEFSIAIPCTHGAKPAPPLLPLLFQKHYGLGQYVFDLPVSTEVSVKGGKGIWGMPKHQANLNYTVGERVVSSQYEKDGQFAMRIEIDRPRAWLPLRTAAANYCQFRGMLMKSFIYFHGHFGFGLGRWAGARLYLGDSPRVQPLKALNISKKPFFVGFLPDARGVLDDHFENWFLSYPALPATQPEGLESVVNLGQSQQWLPPPHLQPGDSAAAGVPRFAGPLQDEVPQEEQEDVSRPVPGPSAGADSGAGVHS